MKGKLKPRDERPPTERKRTFRDAQNAGVFGRRTKWRHEDSIAHAYKKGNANDS